MMKLKSKLLLSCLVFALMLMTCCTKFFFIEKEKVSAQEPTQYEYQQGTFFVYQNAYEGTIFAEYDAVNINANKEARLYALMETQYVYAVGGITAGNLNQSVGSNDYLVIDMHNLIAAAKSDITVMVNDVAMAQSDYYLVNQRNELSTQTSDSITLPAYKNNKVTINSGTVQSFMGQVVIPVSAFSGVNKITSVTVAAKLTQTNFNVGKIGVSSDFNTLTGAMTVTNIWTPSSDNYSVYNTALDKTGNTYTIQDILTVTYLQKGDIIFTGAYAQGSINQENSTATRNYFFWTFPEEMIDSEDGMVHLKDLGIKGLIFDYEAETTLQLAIRLGAGSNSDLGYVNTVYQTSNSKPNQRRILESGLIKTGNTSYMPGDFKGSVYIPFNADSWTGTGWTGEPDIVYPVIYLDYNNSNMLNVNTAAKITNIRFLTDDISYQPNLITMASANGLLEGMVDDVAIGTDSNNKVISGTTVDFFVTPNKGYEVKSVTYAFENDEETKTAQLDQNNQFSITVTDSVSVNVEYQLINYTVTYELNGGINSEENPATFTYLKGFELNDPTKENGAEFLGWYDNADFEGEAITEIPDGTDHNVTLYAKWNEPEAPAKTKGSCKNAATALAGIISLAFVSLLITFKR